MAPAHLLSAEDKALRVQAFENEQATVSCIPASRIGADKSTRQTHVPFAAIYSRAHTPVLRDDGKPCPKDTGKASKPRKATLRVKQLAGIEAY